MINVFERSRDTFFTDFTDHGHDFIDSYVSHLMSYLTIGGYHLTKYISNPKENGLFMKHCIYGSTLAEMMTGGSSGVYNL